MPDRLAEVFAKLRSGQALSEEEIMLLVGHSSSAMTNVYFGDMYQGQVKITESTCSSTEMKASI